MGRKKKLHVVAETPDPKVAAIANLTKSQIEVWNRLRNEMGSALQMVAQQIDRLFLGRIVQKAIEGFAEELNLDIKAESWVFNPEKLRFEKQATPPAQPAATPAPPAA